MRKNLVGRSKFTHFAGRHFQEDGRLLSKAGFLDCKTISKLDEQTRKYIMEDLRKEGVTAIRFSLIDEIFNHYENEKLPKHDSSDEKPRMKLSLKSCLSRQRCADGQLT